MFILKFMDEEKNSYVQEWKKNNINNQGSVQVEKFCETIDEVINSQEFERAFEIVLDKDNKYNKSYFLWILWKIRNLQELEKKEKEDFLDLLDDDNFQEIAKKVYNKVRWLTIEQAEQFLEFYPVEDMIFSLRDKANKRFLETLTYKYELEEEVEINWERFLKISKKDENWNVKKWVIKESEKEQAEEKCVFDNIWRIKEVNWEIYYVWVKWNKEWLIKYWDENKVREKCVFIEIQRIQGMDWEIFYYWLIWWNKRGWIKYWDEDEADNILVDTISLSDLKKDKKWVYFEYSRFFNRIKKYISLKKEKTKNENDNIIINNTIDNNNLKYYTRESGDI